MGSNEYFATRDSQSNQQFVATMFHDLTGSDPSTTVANSLLNQLKNGTDRGTVAFEVLKSQAGLEFVVQNYYQQILGRRADTGGLAFFVHTLRNGGREGEVQRVMLGSDEYFSHL